MYSIRKNPTAMLSMKLITSTALRMEFSSFQVVLPMVCIFSKMSASDSLFWKFCSKSQLSICNAAIKSPCPKSLKWENQLRQNYKIIVISFQWLLCLRDLIYDPWRELWLDLATYMHPPFLWVLGRFARLWLRLEFCARSTQSNRILQVDVCTSNVWVHWACNKVIRHEDEDCVLNTPSLERCRGRRSSLRPEPLPTRWRPSTAGGKMRLMLWKEFNLSQIRSKCTFMWLALDSIHIECCTARWGTNQEPRLVTEGMHFINAIAFSFVQFFLAHQSLKCWKSWRHQP